jgi:hypothetical protein
MSLRTLTLHSNYGKIGLHQIVSDSKTHFMSKNPIFDVFYLSQPKAKFYLCRINQKIELRKP